MFPVGSPQWRILNYGPIAFLKYLFFDLFRFENNQPKEPLIEYPSKIRDLFPISENQVMSILKMCDEYMDSCDRYLENSGKKFKNVTSREKRSITRLFVIGATLVSQKPEVFVETGTQHGISSSFAYLVSKKFALPTKVYSFDVVNSSRVMVDFPATLRVLTFPIRVRIRSEFKKIVEAHGSSVVFFHDSDHSYENTLWELRTANSILQPETFIVDDAETNSALMHFSASVKYNARVVKLDSGPGVGLILKNHCDPDGT